VLVIEALREYFLRLHNQNVSTEVGAASFGRVSGASDMSCRGHDLSHESVE